jgi:HK97 family phage prohead protease
MEQKRVPLSIKTLRDREFEGYGSVFGNEDLGGDVVLEGAFRKSLSKHAKDGSFPLMFWSHDPAQVPGAWVDMQEDDAGLYVRGQLADTQLGNEVRTLLGMKAVRGLSIGFSIPRGGADFDGEGTRLIKEADLWEVSVVSLPMNPRAQVRHAKTRLSAQGEYVPTRQEMSDLKRRMEHWLRQQGLSKAASVAYASLAFRDDEGDPTAANSVDGATPIPGRRDAGSTDEDQLAKQISGLADNVLAAMIHRKFKEHLK